MLGNEWVCVSVKKRQCVCACKSIREWEYVSVSTCVCTFLLVRAFVCARVCVCAAELWVKPISCQKDGAGCQKYNNHLVRNNKTHPGFLTLPSLFISLCFACLSALAAYTHSEWFHFFNDKMFIDKRAQVLPLPDGMICTVTLHRIETSSPGVDKFMYCYCPRWFSWFHLQVLKVTWNDILIASRFLYLCLYFVLKKSCWAMTHL